jgi:hypothetical protein
MPDNTRSRSRVDTPLVRRRTPSERKRRILADWISIAQVMVALFALVSVGGGLILAAATEQETAGVGSQLSRPYLGLGTAFLGAFLTVMSIAILAYFAWRVEESKER